MTSLALTLMMNVLFLVLDSEAQYLASALMQRS